MAEQPKYNMNNSSIKRIMLEVKELQRDVNPHYTARPLDDNLFEWHFTIRGPPDSPFEGGIYHGRIILPADYPFKPPNIVLLTPNGRFEVNKKICLSISAYHPEFWQPGWSIRTVLVALIGFMPTKGEGAIGALDYTSEERIVLAKQSHTYRCPQCGCLNSETLPEETEEDRQKLQDQIDETKSQIPQAPPGETNGKQESNNVVATTVPALVVDPAAVVAPGAIAAVPDVQLLDGEKEEENGKEEEEVERRSVRERRPTPAPAPAPELQREAATQPEVVITEEEYNRNIIKRRLDIAINVIFLSIFILMAQYLYNS
ncbi:ubiquitin-conjugating enzyme E2, J1 (predicted) [Planoprotostelium fungivorum]|uniref:Ubiquitin-conjugating enzyme E2, J1 (Predicted) n=1 Tax=Planoprotostelium fungivorum TaxID=1890364 RepID=A0A2P6MRT7_9EUKA|nr:ubiquitin-conjugating enzyme E2, J1 (predicted) [Planoprotostelium fungivorum]